MKYLMLSYTPAAAWDAATADHATPEAVAAFEMYQRFEQELIASGEFVASEGLGHPAVSVTIRKSPDGMVATDGPFAELKEVLASFAIIEAASQERAIEIASRVVDALGEPVEIRPIMGEDFVG